MRAAAAARSPEGGTGGLRRTAVNPSFVGQCDARELHAVDQKIFLDTERQKRIFDPKVRTIGIDKQKLDQQVYEKIDLHRLEQDRDDWVDKQMVLQDKHAQAMQAETEILRVQKDRDVQWYRDTYQKRHAGREWDLNDPNGKKKDLPARVGDDDPRCGPSSMQKFEGEDTYRNLRGKAQRDELRAFLDRQIEEKNLKEWRDGEMDRVWEERAEEVKRKIHEAERLAMLQRRQAVTTTADFNKALAEQKRREAALAKLRDEQQKTDDIANQLNSKLLNEVDEVLVNGRRSNAKGLHRDQLQAIYNQQAQQLEELRQKRIRDAEDERLRATRSEQERGMSLMLEKKLHEEKRDLRRKLDSENAQQRYLALLKEAERKRLYAQEVGEQYFEPFCPPDYHNGVADRRKPTR